MYSRDVSIVHGPPGTGKTTTLVEAIYETLHREPQVLVCAQSNTAVDWISEKLIDRGVNVLRIGNPTRVNDKMLSFTYERRFEGHPAYSELWSIRKAMREMGGKHRGSYEERESARNRMSRLPFEFFFFEFIFHMQEQFLLLKMVGWGKEVIAHIIIKSLTKVIILRFCTKKSFNLLNL